MSYRREFNVALEEAERINEREFKGRLLGGGGALIRETKKFLHFRFSFIRDDRGSLTDSRPESQEKIIEVSGVKLFSGIIDSRYKKDSSESKLLVDVFVVNNATYDEHSRELDRAERLKRLRGEC